MAVSNGRTKEENNFVANYITITYTNHNQLQKGTKRKNPSKMEGLIIVMKGCYT